MLHNSRHISPLLHNKPIIWRLLEFDLNAGDSSEDINDEAAMKSCQLLPNLIFTSDKHSSTNYRTYTNSGFYQRHQTKPTKKLQRKFSTEKKKSDSSRFNYREMTDKRLTSYCHYSLACVREVAQLFHCLIRL